MATISGTWTYNTGIDVPWKDNVFSIFDIDTLNLEVNQSITSITYANPPTDGGSSGFRILALVYKNLVGAPADVLFNPAPGYGLVGILVRDADNNILIPENALGNNGDIIFNDPTLTADEKNKKCFDKLVWDKQCIFGKDVLNLVNEISFGYIKPGALDCLKNRKRALQILNGYDTRDIENDTTDYNDITYTTIKKLLEL